MTEAKKITIVDIAARANVSPSTVSRVLNGSARVKESKRLAVEQAVADLNYQPNIFAQSLASGQSTTIGVLTQNVGSPFYDSILQGILHGLEDTPYSPIFADGRWQEEIQTQMITTLLDRRVDGLILLGGQTPVEMLQTIAQQTPLVMVARLLPGFEGQCVLVDNFKAAYQATNHLISLGHQRIVHITTPSADKVATDDVGQRFLGYKRALADAGISFEPELIAEGNLQQQSGLLAVEHLLMGQRPFSAIFAANDQMAYGVRLGLYRRGLRVPEDVSLVGFDDHPFAAFMVPPLTTLHQPAMEMGLAAAKAIINLINGESTQIELFEAKLMIRESVARH